MLGNKKFNMIISIILAISLWAYVVGEINPTAERTIKDVEIKYTHSDMLAERGLAMSEASAYSLEVEVAGSRSEISKLGPDDISAVVDLGTAVKGENEISVSVKAPDGVTVSKKSISAVSVKVENLVSKEVPVTIHYSGNLEAPKEGETVSKSFDEVKVSGAESNVDKVKEAVGTINVLNISEDVTTTKCKLVPVDRKGDIVDNVSLSKNTVSVDSVISETKTVKLNVNIIDNSSDGLTREAEYPKEVIIAGKSADLKKIDSVDAGSIDISNLGDGSHVELNVKLPEGIILSEKNEKLYVKVSVESLESKTFSISSDDIDFAGKKDGFKYSFEQTFTVDITVTDKKDIVESLKKEDFALSVDVASFAEAGSFDVKITVKPSVSVSGVKISQDTAKVVVS